MDFGFWTLGFGNMEVRRHNFKALKVWQLGVQLATDVYALTAEFPDAERYGLTAQMRRAAVSVPSNIAEGAGRNTDKSFQQFISIALGSLNELETQLVIADRLGLNINRDAHHRIIDSIEQLGKMLTKLMHRLQANSSNTVSDTETSYMLSYSYPDIVPLSPKVEAIYDGTNFLSMKQSHPYSHDDRR
ncbi:MAG: four helix bundle protein [Flavobacteriales bacterium]